MARLTYARRGPGSAGAKFMADIRSRVAVFAEAELSARRSAAAEATTVTRDRARAVRPYAPDRDGRASGRMSQTLKWTPTDETSRVSGVRFDLASAEANSPYWAIQEVGTGPKATAQMFRANPKDPANPVKAGTITVPTQVGRVLPRGLGWGTGVGGKFQRPGEGQNQQIYRLVELDMGTQGTGGNTRNPRSGNRATHKTEAARIIIRREIPPKGMVKAGGIAGFRRYSRELLAGWQQAFKRSRRS